MSRWPQINKYMRVCNTLVMSQRAHSASPRSVRLHCFHLLANKVSVLSGSEKRKCFLEAVNTGLIYDLCRVFRCSNNSEGFVISFPPNRKVCIPPPSARSEKLFIWIARHVQIYACGSRGPCHQGLINSDTGWQFSCCADVFRHTCAGDWRAFKVFTFLLWKYPFSCETAVSAAICQEASPTASSSIWNNSRLKSSWDSFVKLICPFVIFSTVKLY